MPTRRQILLKESTPEWMASASIAELEEKKKQINLTSAIPRFAIRALITAMNFELSAFSCIDSSVLISSLFLVSKL